MTDKPAGKAPDCSWPMAVLGKTLQRIGKQKADPTVVALGQKARELAGGDPLAKKEDDPTQP